MRNLLKIVTLIALSPAAIADLQHDVKCQEIGFSKSVEAKDADKFRSFIDPDARFVGNSVAKGVDLIVERWRVFFDTGGPLIKWRPQFVEVLEDGELALTRGPYKMTTTDVDGQETDHWGTFNSVWRLSDDKQWRVVFDAGDESEDAPTAEIRALIEANDDCDLHTAK
jgi:ketosteroid isomerase-like protein